MDTLLPLIFYSLPYVIAVLLALVLVALAGVTLGRPWLIVLPILVPLFWLTETRFGRLDLGGGPTLLTRGAGVLLFPAFLWGMLVALAWVRFGALFRRDGTAFHRMSVTPWFAAWAVLLLAHAVVGAVAGVPVNKTLSPAGFSFVVWIWVWMALMVAAVGRPGDARWLALFIMVMAVARALFGLVRFAAFGGDPANAYANNQGLTLRLTFFDINDSLLCALSVVMALVLLYRAAPACGWRAWQKALLWLAVAVPALCIVLSFRRTAWVGLLLAMVFVLLQLPGRVRWKFIVTAMPVLLLGIGYAAWKRLSQVRGPSTGFLYDLTSRSFGAESQRVLELQLAWQSFIASPLYGVGSWGRYKGWEMISWQHEFGEGGGGTFLHSGVLHLALKTGLIGMLLLAGTALAFWLAWRRLRRSLPAPALPLAVAGVAGVLFMMPDWLIGTPISQLRTMMMLGLCMSLPFVAERCFAGAPVQADAEPKAALAAGPRRWRTGRIGGAAATPLAAR